MCVEYLEKHLVDEKAKFDIPELEVRQQSQNIDPEIEMVDPVIAHDTMPPQLCECDELGSICGVCKLLMDKIVTSIPSSSPFQVTRSGDETMTPDLNFSDSLVSSTSFVSLFSPAPNQHPVTDLPDHIFRDQDEVFDEVDNSTSLGNNVTASSDNTTTAEQIREIKEMNNECCCY